MAALKLNEDLRTVIQFSRKAKKINKMLIIYKFVIIIIQNLEKIR